MIEEMMSAYGGRLTIAVIGVGIALLCLVGILRFLRGRNGPSPFVRGGRNRNPRLQVLDAAAVDARRRLVLVRRDNVEHLVMIGGPTDIVIETGITSAPDHRAAASAPAQNHAQPPLPDPRAAALAAQARTARPAEPRAEASLAEPARSLAAPSAAPLKMEPLQSPQAVAPQPASTISARPAPRPLPARTETSRTEPAAPGIDDAAQALEAARGRGVLQDKPIQDRTPTPTTIQTSIPASVVSERAEIAAATTKPAQSPQQERPASPEKPKGLGSDFEKILEEEMANNLAAREAPRLRIENQPPTQPPTQQEGKAEPSSTQEGRPAVEPTLQDQVARIFGEMSASRDK